LTGKVETPGRERMTGNDVGRTSLGHTYPSARSGVIESNVIVFLIAARLYLEDTAFVSDKHSVWIEAESVQAWLEALYK